MLRPAAPPLTASYPRRMVMLPTTATTPAATVGHHCSRAKNIVSRSRSRRPSRQSFLADAPIASARLPKTMKQARAPATLGKVTSIYLTKGQARHQDFAQVALGPCRDFRSQSPRNGRATISTAMLATLGNLATSRRDRSWSSDPAQTRPATLTRTDCTATTVRRPTPYLVPAREDPRPIQTEIGALTTSATSAATSVTWARPTDQAR